MVKITDDVLDMIDTMQANGFKKWQIKRLLAEKYDIACSRTVERAMARARERRIRELKVNPEDFASEALEFYKGILRNQNASIKEKLMAQQAMQDLIGIGAKYHPPKPPPDESSQLFKEMDGLTPPPGTIPVVPLEEAVHPDPGRPEVGEDGTGEEESGPVAQ